MLGVNNAAKKEASLSARSICELILTLKRNNAHFAQVTVEETCLHPIPGHSYGYDSTKKDDRENTYNAIYFPNWYSFLELSEPEADILLQIGNDNPKAQDINRFIDRLTHIDKMKRNKDLDDEQYEILLNGYLDKITN